MTRKSCAELKLEARRALKGNYSIAVGAMLIFTVLITVVIVALQIFVTFATMGSMAVGSALKSPAMEVGTLVVSSLSSLVIVVIEYLMIPGYMKLLLNICTGRKFELGDLFYVFTHKPHKFLLLALVMWLVGMIMMVPMLLLGLLTLVLPAVVTVVLGIVVFIAVYVAVIILMLNLSMVFYIMLDDPDIGVIQCLKESCRIMKGNKGRLFYIGLSFIGIALLTLFSFGLGYLWVAPYICAATTCFYLDIRGPRKEDVTWDQTAGDSIPPAAGYQYDQSPV